MQEMDHIGEALTQVDKEILVFERNLREAQQRKGEYLREQQEAEAKKQQETDQQREIREYEEKIAELKRQIAAQSGAPTVTAQDEEADETEVEEFVEEIVEYVEEEEDYEEEIIEEEVTEDGDDCSDSTAPPAGVYDNVEGQPKLQEAYDYGEESPDVVASNPANDPSKKEKVSWEQPSWAVSGGLQAHSHKSKEEQPKPKATAKPKGPMSEKFRKIVFPSGKAPPPPSAEQTDSKEEKNRLGFFANIAKPTQKTTVYKKVAVKMETPLVESNSEEPSSSDPKPQPKAPSPLWKGPEKPTKKHGWAKPSWALPQKALEKNGSNDTAIETASVPNHLKANHSAGYERKVFIKQVRRIDGKFQTPQQKVPPRLAWVVIFQRRGKALKKLGKIVVHLYGRDVAKIIDCFLDLQNCDLEICGTEVLASPETKAPTFSLTTNSQNIDKRPGVYGLVQEGQEVLQKVLESDPREPCLIKQAHIFPVKKARGQSK